MPQTSLPLFSSSMSEANARLKNVHHFQLYQALQAFGIAHQLSLSWSRRTYNHLLAADITSTSDLVQGCRDGTINLDLELFGVKHEHHLSNETLQALQVFLPGPMGIRCFRLAQKAASMVEKGSANVKYVHRPMSGELGDEIWDISIADDHWTLHVDCAGFVRNTLKHVTKSSFVMALSDRDFMRAKDFFLFFRTLPCTVLDTTTVLPNFTYLWRRVDDLRYVIAGDIICYRPRGNASGGAAFTENDRKNLVHILQAVKAAQLWHEAASQQHKEEGVDGNQGLVARNVAKDPAVKIWVKQFRAILHKIGIRTPKKLREQIHQLNSLLVQNGEPPLDDFMHSLILECLKARALNTGHIVFVSGPAVLVNAETKEYRIRVVHSTKFGVPDENGNPTEGVQEYFRRFQMVPDPEQEGKFIWTRAVSLTPPVEMNATPVVTSEDMEDPNETIEESVEDDEGDEGEDDTEGSTDAPLLVEVVAARMCF